MKYVRCEGHCKYPAYDKEEVDNLFENVYKKGDFAVLTGQIVMTNNLGTKEVDYPEGFTQANCVVLSFGQSRNGGTGNICFGYGIRTVDYVRGSVTRNVSLKSSSIEITVTNAVDENTTEYTYDYKIVLMKMA